MMVKHIVTVQFSLHNFILKIQSLNYVVSLLSEVWYVIDDCVHFYHVILDRRKQTNILCQGFGILLMQDEHDCIHVKC